MAVLPETCGCGGTRPTLTVSHDNSCDDYVTVVPLIPTGHYALGHVWPAKERNGVLKALAHHFLITKENLL